MRGLLRVLLADDTTRGDQIMNANNYVPMCKALLEHVRFSEVSPVASPDGSPFDAIKLAEIVKTRQGLLPAMYRTAYVAPLIATLPQVVMQLKELFSARRARGMSEGDATAEAKSFADTLVGAVSDWGESVYRHPLARFEAVVSNLYRSFLSKQQRATISLPLIETVPPLVTFAPTADGGPFTLPIDGVKQFTGASVGVVSLPGSYAEHPILWAALAHEVGGHDVLHADPGLLEELAARVANLDGVPHWLGSIWGAWMDETASDVYGLLNIGPSFAVSLAAFFAALEVSGEAHHAIGTIRTVLPVANHRLVDPHPVDLLRLYVAMGVVEGLEALSVAKRHAWLGVIEAIAQVAAGSATTIDVVDVGSREVVQKLPLEVMASAAKKVGKFIASAKLDALGGHSIQEIETWDGADERAAADIAAAAATTSIVGMGDDAQLLAGASIAFLNDPTKYRQITAHLNDALDDSFARDPIFGSAMPQSGLVLKRRGRAMARTPASPQFPIVIV
jgi:hypothetical protein